MCLCGLLTIIYRTLDDRKQEPRAIIADRDVSAESATRWQPCTLTRSHRGGAAHAQAHERQLILGGGGASAARESQWPGCLGRA